MKLHMHFEPILRGRAAGLCQAALLVWLSSPALPALADEAEHAPSVTAAQPADAPLAATPPQAEGSTADTQASAPLNSPRAAHNHHPLSAAERLNEHVQALTKSLELDERQQKALRAILIEERAGILKLRRGENHDIVAAAQALKAHTREQIRALLNEEQRKKFFTDVPEENLAPAHADRDYWIEQTRPRPAAASPDAASAAGSGSSPPARSDAGPGSGEH